MGLEPVWTEIILLYKQKRRLRVGVAVTFLASENGDEVFATQKGSPKGGRELKKARKVPVRVESLAHLRRHRIVLRPARYMSLQPSADLTQNLITVL